MAAIPIEAVSLTGSAPNMQAASAGGDTFANDGNTLLRVTNGGTGAITVTVTAVQPCNQGVLHNAVANVAAGATADIGPFAPPRFNDSTGSAAVTYSGVTTVTVGAVRL